MQVEESIRDVERARVMPNQHICRYPGCTTRVSNDVDNCRQHTEECPSCKHSDAWRCAVDKGLPSITCSCLCHQGPRSKHNDLNHLGVGRDD